MEIKRDLYLNKLIKREKNGLVKVITGIRRCGKSYLLFHLYHDYLINKGVQADHIIEIALDDIINKELREPMALYKHIKEQIKDNSDYYLFLDEIQFVGDFSDLVNGLSHIRNLDVYITGSNSKFLSSDILTEFRGRGDEIRVYPLSFAEYSTVYDGSVSQAWKDYYTYGGLPLILTRADDEMKAEYLTTLLDKVYISDIVERNKVRNESELGELINILASSVGSLTNPSKLARTFASIKQSKITNKTIKKYLDYLTDAFLMDKALRYDVKGKKYIETPSKYYFVDVGIRNAKLNFRQQEENHIMENIIFNELKIRGCRVDVGLVEIVETANNGKRVQKGLEIDFIATKGNNKYYIQSAFEMPTEAKEQQEKRSLQKVNDSFKKIVVVKDDIKLKRDDDGITTMGIFDFLLNENSLDM
ncbi:MAG: ATP-binding protein [Monoglobaceae bacterium]